MKKKNYMDIFVPVLMFLAVCFVIGITYFRQETESAVSAAVEMTYETSLFDDSRVQSVEIVMDESSWQDMLDNAASEQFYACNIIINGVTYKNVGIRPKGNTSLTMIASDSTTDRYSFKVDFGKYIEGQTCDGLDVLMLNNLMSDATYMKEYLSYDLFKFMDVNASLTAFVEVKVNGEGWGLYLAVEGVDESFARREYGYSHGNLYKPESDDMDGMGDRGGFEEMDFSKLNFDKSEFREEDKSAGMKGFGSSDSGAGLVYTDDEIDSYRDIFDNAVFDVDTAEQKAVIEALKHINAGTELEKYADVDQLLRYMAVNVVLVNLDSYFGTMLHNYYLYEEDGQLSMLPWDYNLAFAGFQSNSAKAAVNLAIDTVVSGASLEDRPIIAKILEVEEYKEKYHEYLQQIVTEYFDSGYFTSKIQYVDTLISPYVKKDATAFYTYEEYKTGVDTLIRFGLLRSQSIQGQLNGTIPSTEEGQKADESNLVDASSINISDMGTQGGGMHDISMSDKDMPDKDMPGQGMSDQGMPGQDMSGQGMSDQDMSDQDMPDKDMSDKDMSGQGMPGQGMPGQDMSDQDMSDKDVSGQDKQNIDNQDINMFGEDRQGGMNRGNGEMPQRPDRQNGFNGEDMSNMQEDLLLPSFIDYSAAELVMIGISLVIAVAALVWVKVYKRRKYRTN